MLYQLVSECDGALYNLGWISLQPDGSVSIGLQDKSFISPRLRARIGVWSVFNRVKMRFTIPSTPDALDFVVNPHITFHPPVRFHVKSNKDKVRLDQTVFEGIADLGIVLDQDGKMPWVRAVTGPISDMRTPTRRTNNLVTHQLVSRVPSIQSSATISVDFLRLGTAHPRDALSTHYIPLTYATLKVEIGLTYCSLPTLGWYHSY